MYFIDYVYDNEKDNTIVIKGWSFDENSKEPLQINVKADFPIKKVLQKNDFRYDVVYLFNLSTFHNYGFFMEIFPEEIKGKITLQFINNLGQVVHEDVIDLDKKKWHEKQLDVKKEARKKIVNYFLSYFKSGNGIRALLGKLRKQLPGMDPKYKLFLEKYEHEDYEKQREEEKHFKLRPLVSILIPVYNIDLRWLKKCIDSVFDQTYTNWQLCIADDNSDDPKIREYLTELEESSDKVKVVFRKENGHISEATNSALELADGEFIALLDDDDELAPNALFEYIKYLNEHPDTDIFYSDEDKIDVDGVRSEPYFKTDFAPDSLFSNNYICHFLMFRKSLIQGEEFLRTKYNGAQDFDLILRLTEKSNKIHHVPKVLYHWRIIASSTAKDMAKKKYSIKAGQLALEDALKRRGIKGEIKEAILGGLYDVDYEILNPDKMVSIIIPTKDNPDDLVNCVESIMEKTKYKHFEILIVNNGSVKKGTYEIFDTLKLKYPDHIRVIDLDIPFNYSRINNLAAKEAKGDFYLFLNDDTKVLTRGWIEKMVGFAQQPWIAAVGAKLYYPDYTIQHAGVVMGVLGTACHVYCQYPQFTTGYFGRMISNTNYTCVTAACLMIQKEKFWQVGGFDENLAVAFNDIDLCCALVDAGYYNICLASVELIHCESKTRGYEVTPEQQMRFEKEKYKIKRKWRKYLYRDPMYNPNLILDRGDYSFKG